MENMKVTAGSEYINLSSLLSADWKSNTEVKTIIAIAKEVFNNKKRAYIAIVWIKR